ncbi:MAG: HAMP domain-containing sensor histidine kinase [Pyrinomonadaceae bacterium]
MRVAGRRKTAVVALILGITLIALAVTLNVGWILRNLQQTVLLVLGVIFFSLIITGLVLNTIFLIREIRRNEQQDAFLNAMTHELKTPIASIKLYLETLKTRQVAEQKRNEFYDVMLADSDRLLTTVEQVLQASKTREKSRRLNISEIEIGRMLNECAELIRSRYNLEKEAIKVADILDEIYVSGDSTELKSAFLNLFDNAVKYSNDEVDISVKTRVRQKRLVEIHIKDKGVGISSPELKRIFRRFYRVPNRSTQDAKGTGLGLYIVRSIIQKHNGKIFAKSRGEGKGSSFIVQLPKIRAGG